MANDTFASFSAARNAAAEKAYEEFDFLDRSVEGAGGWESESAHPADSAAEWTRRVYLANEESPSEPSEAVTFVVRFPAGSAEVEEAYVSGW